MAVVPVFTQHAQEIKDILNLDITDTEKMKDFGQTLGIRLAVECPDFMRAVTGNKSFTDGMKDQKRVGSGSLSGTLIKVVPGEFTHFLIKDKQGKTEKIWWMEYFEGADKVSDPKTINKSISVKFKEVEVYNAAIKDYITIKVATAFDK